VLILSWIVRIKRGGRRSCAEEGPILRIPMDYRRKGGPERGLPEMWPVHRWARGGGGPSGGRSGFLGFHGREKGKYPQGRLDRLPQRTLGIEMTVSEDLESEGEVGLKEKVGDLLTKSKKVLREETSAEKYMIGGSEKASRKGRFRWGDLES